MPEPETPAQLAAVLKDCATRLKVTDVGLARVARACPGIEYHIAHGPLAESLRDPHWAQTVSRASLWGLASAADTYEAAPRRPLDRARLNDELEHVRSQALAARSWWQRVNDWLEHWLAERQDTDSANDWLGRLMREILGHAPRAATLQLVMVSVVATLALALSVIAFRRLLPAWRARRPTGRAATAHPAGADAGSEPVLPGDLARRVSARFAERVAAAERAGLLPGARALSCSELRARTAAHPSLATLTAAASVVEAVRYAPHPPADAELAALDAQLATLEIGA